MFYINLICVSAIDLPQAFLIFATRGGARIWGASFFRRAVCVAEPDAERRLSRRAPAHLTLPPATHHRTTYSCTFVARGLGLLALNFAVCVASGRS